jgi:competence protein ComEA
MSHDPIRERLAMLSRAELAGLAVAVVLLFGGAGLWYVRSLPKQIVVAPEPSAARSAALASPSPSASPVLVDVAGWVRRPGVYQLAPDARVIDAIEAAGGARRGAALEALNLAAPLVDGTQILVPKRGQAPAGAAPGTVTSGSGTAGGGLINVNTATAAELETLPGIGEVLAQRIVDYRTEHGPFRSVEDLLDVSGIGEAILGDIRDLVTV